MRSDQLKIYSSKHTHNVPSSSFSLGDRHLLPLNHLNLRLLALPHRFPRLLTVNLTREENNFITSCNVNMRCVAYTIHIVDSSFTCTYLNVIGTVTLNVNLSRNKIKTITFDCLACNRFYLMVIE